MNLLPKATKEFASKEYWDKFFQKRKDSFEWYGSYEEIKTILLQYLKPNDYFLVIGCGNSTLSVDLFDDGYENNTSIDISQVVIDKMISKYKSKGIRSKLQFECMDMMQMRFANESFNIVLDKGTLDAICSDSNIDIDKCFTEISRVLKYFGRYICVSLLQEHVLNKLLSWFTVNQNWICRIEMIQSKSNETNVVVDTVNFPVFIVTCLKMKAKLAETYVEMDLNGDRKFKKIHNISEVASIIKSYQRMEFLKYMVRNSKMDDENFNIELFDDSNNNDDCRYKFYFVQRSNIVKSNNMIRCSIFIVPQGREHEWMFSTGKGRLELLKQCRCDRLAVVFLSRKHRYENMEKIQNELGNRLQGFFPPTSEKILFLSIGDGDIGERNVIWNGYSEFNGQMFVEDVCIDGIMYRRLVFANNHNIIQSEARLKKCKQGTFRCDQNFLSCDHHQYIAAGLAIINRPFKNVYNLLMIGLGGGCFIAFLANNLRPSDDIVLRITVIEIDPLLEEVAKKYFDFQQKTKRNIEINIIIDDGLHYLRSKSQDSQNMEKFDFIIFDVDSKNIELGVSCPPPEFVENECLNQVQTLLNDDGFFILNLVARNEDLKQIIYERLKNLFQYRFRCKLDKDVNEIIFVTNNEKLEWLRNDWNSNSRYDYIRKCCFHIDLLAETYRQMCSKLSFC
ncbi:eEF1A lysine and N-terminal methyltransferase homolog [Dermatophagoides pteronyssinus]|uniref:eEF1A lysine and N-terminal methyltransferase homolog n=1 Tax=Dermatophagoides pteronyssinus TaxID=6956 RepID=UPI003F66C501